MSREEKGGSTASQKATSIAAVGLFVCKGNGKGCDNCLGVSGRYMKVQ